MEQDAAYADQAVRISRDGTPLLARRRRLADGQVALWLVTAIRGLPVR